MHQNAGHSSNDIYVKSHSTTPLALQGGGPAPMKNTANMDAQMQARMNEYLNSGVNMDQAATKKPQSDGRVIRKQNYSQNATTTMADKSTFKQARAASEIRNDHNLDSKKFNNDEYLAFKQNTSM